MNSERRSTQVRTVRQAVSLETQYAEHRESRTWVRALPTLTRCHELLSRRSEAQSRTIELVSKIEAVIQKALGVDFALKARLQEKIYDSPVSFKSEAGFVIIELTKHNSFAVLEVEILSLVALLSLVAGEAPRLTPVLSLTRLEEAGLGYLALHALSEMRKQDYWQTRFDAHFRTIVTRRDEALKFVRQEESFIAAEIEIRAAEFCGASRLFLPRRIFENVLREIDPDEVHEKPKRLGQCQLTFTPRLGPATLEDEEFDSIQLQDVLVFDNLLKDSYAEGKCSLKGAAFHLHGRLGERGFEVEEIQTLAQPKDLRMHGSNNLPIEIEIELAKVRLPLSVLNSLTKGSILPLRISPHEEVILKVGDMTFAKAILVDVEGQIGAKIVSLEG